MQPKRGTGGTPRNSSTDHAQRAVSSRATSPSATRPEGPPHPPNTAMSEWPRRTALCRERGAGGTPCTSGWPTCGETKRRGERGCHWAACVHQRLAYLKRRRHPHARRHRRRARRAVATDQLQPIQRRRGHSLMGAAEEEHLMKHAISMQSACNQHAISMQSACNQHAISPWEPPKRST